MPLWCKRTWLYFHIEKHPRVKGIHTFKTWLQENTYTHKHLITTREWQQMGIYKVTLFSVSSCSRTMLTPSFTVSHHLLHGGLFVQSILYMHHSHRKERCRINLGLGYSSSSSSLYIQQRGMHRANCYSRSLVSITEAWEVLGSEKVQNKPLHEDVASVAINSQWHYAWILTFIYTGHAFHVLCTGCLSSMTATLVFTHRPTFSTALIYLLLLSFQVL